MSHRIVPRTGLCVLAMTLSLSACSRSAPPSRAAEPAQAPPPAAPAAASGDAGPVATAPTDRAGRNKKGRADRRGRRPRGGMGMLERALDALDLTDAQQKQVAGIFAELGQTMRSQWDSKIAFRRALAEASRDGKVSVDEMKPELDRVSAAATERIDKLTAAIDKLHATLDAGQRKQLAEALDRRGPGKGRGGKGHGPRGHGPPGHRGGQKGYGARGGPGGKGAGPGPDRFGFLHLTDDQRARIRKALADAKLEQPGKGSPEAWRAEARDRMEALEHAFVGDDFKAADYLHKDEVVDKACEWAMFEVKRLSVVLPLLTDEQRSQLIEHLSEPPGPSGHWHRGPGHRGKGPPGRGRGKGRPGMGPPGGGPPPAAPR